MATHQCSIDCCVRRLYLCHVDRAKEYLVLLFNCVVTARPVEDAAGGSPTCCTHPVDSRLRSCGASLIAVALSLSL